MSLLAGLIKPDPVRSSCTANRWKDLGQTVGIVFQNYSLLPWLTVYDNIALAVDQVFSQLVR